MNEFLASNEWQWRLLRTIVQGVLGVLIALELGLCERGLDARAFSLRTCQRARSLNARSLDLIMGWCVLDPSMRGLVMALVMAVLSPIMAALGGDGDKPEIPRGEARGA